MKRTLVLSTQRVTRATSVVLVQEKYGVAKDEAERQVASFEKRAKDDWFGPRT